MLIFVDNHSLVENPEFRALPSFLFGESMGGAIALKVHLKQPDAWSGAILIAPMCKVLSELALRSYYNNPYHRVIFNDRELL